MGKEYGVKYSPGPYRTESLHFIRECLGEEKFTRLLGTKESRDKPYVAAKLFLTVQDWDKYVWIEHHGSLTGFEGSDTDASETLSRMRKSPVRFMTLESDEIDSDELEQAAGGEGYLKEDKKEVKS